ncbi:hypothetical protein JVU11DRAFT_3599 [Chiua virens]|nr:hypothetical protein JVU11DRAFT_3599 [Chiua virens]
MLSATLKIHLTASLASAGMLWGLDTGEFPEYLSPVPPDHPGEGSLSGPLTQMTQFSRSIGHISSGQLGIHAASASISYVVGHVADVISRKYGILTGGFDCRHWNHYVCLRKQFSCLDLCSSDYGHLRGQSISVVTIYLCKIALTTRHCGKHASSSSSP